MRINLRYLDVKNNFFMKTSIITVVRNGVKTIADAILSVQAQDYLIIEHLIIEGASTDGTLRVIENFMNEDVPRVSETDNGIYDALNKGFSYSSGLKAFR